jgi:hypothetical protein
MRFFGFPRLSPAPRLPPHVATTLVVREWQSSVAVPGRLELPTFGLGNRCSIRLSYGTMILFGFELVRLSLFGTPSISTARQQRDPALRGKHLR